MKLADSTIKNYWRNVRLLLGQYPQSDVNPFEPMAFCKWLAETKFPLAAATWRQYRASALFHIKERFPAAHAECSEYLAAFSSHNKPSGVIRAKQKGYSDEQISALLKYIQGSMHNPRSRGNGKIWWSNLYYTLVAGGLVGLRPCEWQHARVKISEGQCSLIIKNAKTTHGRSHGPTRTIDISGLSEMEVEDIQRKIELTRAAIDSGLCEDMDEYQVRLREYLLKANNKVLPGADKTIAVYSTRHQVVTEYKSTEGATEEGMAAILGHLLIITSKKHYGRKNKKKSSTGKLKASMLKADPGDVQRVIELNIGRECGPPKKIPSPPPSSPATGPSF
jgi:hypothetical protein